MNQTPTVHRNSSNQRVDECDTPYYTIVADEATKCSVCEGPICKDEVILFTRGGNKLHVYCVNEAY